MKSTMMEGEGAWGQRGEPHNHLREEKTSGGVNCVLQEKDEMEVLK